MASKTHTRPEPFPPIEVWPPDDTEESILGTDLHQTTITNLRLGINEVARLRQAPGQPVPWKALSQIVLLGCVRPDGSAYRTYPDVLVYPHVIDPERGSVTLEVDGPPVLIIDVLSESTYGNERLEARSAKRRKPDRRHRRWVQQRAVPGCGDFTPSAPAGRRY
jgi:hypothetical protein